LEGFVNKIFQVFGGSDVCLHIQDVVHGDAGFDEALHDFVEAGNAAAGEDDLPASLPKAKRCR
jgi:hypothetical protein